MRLKDFFYLLGFKPKPKRYGHTVVEFDLPTDGKVRYAMWDHPKYRRFSMDQEAVDNTRVFLKPGDVAINIGAHSGDTFLPMALAAGPEGKVFAFEPNPYVLDTLRANAGLNPELTNVEVVPYAATPEPGKLTFNYSGPDFLNGGNQEGVSRWRHAHAFTLEVEGVNVIDHLNKVDPTAVSRVRFLKVDTEGFDLSVLK